MDIIRFAIHFQNDKAFFITNRLNGLIHQIFYRPKKDRLPVFCHQNQMVLQQKAAVSVGVIGLIFLALVHDYSPQKLNIHLNIYYNNTSN